MTSMTVPGLEVRYCCMLILRMYYHKMSKVPILYVRPCGFSTKLCRTTICSTAVYVFWHRNDTLLYT